MISAEELAEIALVHALRHSIALQEDAALEIGKRARGSNFWLGFCNTGKKVVTGDW